MSELRIVDTSDKIYIELKDKYDEVYRQFKEFAQKLSDQAGKVKKSSNKADSYANSLIKLTVLYKEIYKQEISVELLDTFDGLNELEKITKLTDFKEFNNNGSHFLSATLKCFKEFIIDKYPKYDGLKIISVTASQDIAHQNYLNTVINKKSISELKDSKKINYDLIERIESTYGSSEFSVWGVKGKNQKFIEDFSNCKDKFFLIFYTQDNNSKISKYQTLARVTMVESNNEELGKIFWNDSTYKHILFLDSVTKITVDTVKIKQLVENNFRYANYLTCVPDSLKIVISNIDDIENNELYSFLDEEKIDFSCSNIPLKKMKSLSKDLGHLPEEKSGNAIDYENKNRKNKITGSHGEHIAEKLIKQKFSPIEPIIERCKEKGGDVYGYDYLVKSKVGKHLVEVKSTSVRENPPFFMSQREFTVMNKCMNNENGYEEYDYHILRIVGIDTEKKTYDNFEWITIDSKSFEKLEFETKTYQVGFKNNI